MCKIPASTRLGPQLRGLFVYTNVYIDIIFIERKRYLAHYIILHITYIYICIVVCLVFEDNNIHFAPLIFDQI